MNKVSLAAAFHDLGSCFECAEFPCPKLRPTSDDAARYPRNRKVYNLCRIRNIGIGRRAKEEASDIRRRCFQGAFIVGSGPVMKKVLCHRGLRGHREKIETLIVLRLFSVLSACGRGYVPGNKGF